MTSLQIGMGWFPEQPGGLNRMVYNLVRALPGAGIEVCGLVAADAAGGSVRPFAPREASLARRLVGARRAISAALEASDSSRPEVVASHFALYTAPAADRLRDVPLVVHFHGPWAAEGVAEGAGRAGRLAKKAVEQAVYRRADRFIVLSEAFRDVLVADYGADPDRIRLVPGGVEADRFDTGLTRGQARERLGWPTDRPIVLAVRRLARRMGLEDLVEAVVRVRASVPDALVLIAGRGALADALSARIQALGLEDHVRLVGFISDDDLPLAYRAADLSVVPTVALEGFGLIAAESLAAGTPALVTPVGGLPEVVRDLSPDLVLPATGAGAVADGLIQALGGHLPLPTDQECQRFARQRYAWPAVAQATQAVYAEVT